jgi:hypothetical protein
MLGVSGDGTRFNGSRRGNGGNCVTNNESSIRPANGANYEKIDRRENSDCAPRRNEMKGNRTEERDSQTQQDTHDA